MAVFHTIPRCKENPFVLPVEPVFAMAAKQEQEEHLPVVAGS